MEALLRSCKFRLFDVYLPSIVPVRTGKRVTRITGLPPYKAKTIVEKLEDADYKDPAVHYRVNIGLPQVKHDTDEKQKAYLKSLKENKELEKKSRKNEIVLSMDEVAREWLRESASEHVKAAADHYGVFQDLFGDAFFYPQVPVDVSFTSKDTAIPVCRGNLVKPEQAVSPPSVSYDADPNSLWTLIATNPDGHLQQENAEYLHWFLGNIRGSDLKASDAVQDYIQPFPARGTGFQRLVFILFKQTEKIDYSSLKASIGTTEIWKRAFRTYDFYRKYQDTITPAGLAFCQVDWDLSVSNFFHTVLGIEEPVYEYDFDPHYYKKQTMYPIKQPFNLYMDRYRDPKQIGKEFVLKKLKNNHPFDGSKPPLKYPNAVPVYHDLDAKLHGRIPSWLRKEKIKQRMGHGRINDY